MTQLSLPNPLQVQHTTLLEIRRVIAEKLDKPKVEITTIGPKQDYFVVSAQIIFDENKKGSVCYGQCLASGIPLLDTLTAEIIALVFACNEQGITFEFNGKPAALQTPDIAVVKNVVKVDRNILLKCNEIDDVKFKLKSAGMIAELKTLEEYGKELRRNKERLTVRKMVDKIFPKGAAAVYVNEEEPKPNIRQEKKPAIVVEAPIRQHQRSGGEATALLQQLADRGIDFDVVTEKGFTGFSTLAAFAMFATQQQVDQLLAG